MECKSLEQSASASLATSQCAALACLLVFPCLPACPATQVDNWQQVDPAWLVRWIADHARDSKNILKKPLVLEEVSGWVVGWEWSVGRGGERGGALGLPNTVPP